MKPQFSGTEGFINAGTGRLKNKAYKILAVYINDQIDNGWTTYYTSAGHSLTRKDGDPTAEYTVTYIALDKYLLTANPTNVKLTYANNVRTALNDISDKSQDNSTMLSVHEKIILNLFVEIQALKVKP